MNASIDSLLTRYETGTLTRRELIAAIGLVAMPRKTEAQNGMFRARTLHHVNIGVADVSRSEDFYRELLGFSERRYIVGGICDGLPRWGSYQSVSGGGRELQSDSR